MTEKIEDLQTNAERAKVMTEKIEDLQTNAEKAKDRKGVMKMFLFFGIITALIYWNNNMRGCTSDDFCVAGGSEWKLANTGFYDAINGLSMVSNERAIMRLHDGSEQTIAVESYGNDDWGNTINTEGWSVSGVSMSDIMDSLTIRLSFSIPDIADDNGTRVTIVASGDVTFPYILGGNDNVVDRSLGTDMSFDDRTENFSYERALVVMPANWEKPMNIPGWIFWICAVLAGLSCLAIFGFAPHDDEEEARIKALKASLPKE